MNDATAANAASHAEVKGPAGPLSQNNPWNAPAQDPEYMGNPPVLTREQWEARSAGGWSPRSGTPHECSGFGFNGYGNLTVSREDDRVCVIQDEKLPALAALSGMPYTWVDINGLKALAEFFLQLGIEGDRRVAWLVDLVRRLVVMLPPKDVLLSQPALASAPQAERLAAARALIAQADASLAMTQTIAEQQSRTMESAEMEFGGVQPHGKPEPPVEEDPLDTVVAIGKYKGATWAQVLRQDASYCEWAVAEMDRLPDAVREALQDYLEDNFDPSDDDLPM